MRSWFPLLDTLSKHYDLRKDLRGDLNAGLIVAIMLIPQGMAYAMLAGLPPVIGLYASTIPLIIYALFGTSRQLAVGPVAMVSLLVFTGVSGLAEPGTDEYISYVLLLALLVGVIQLLLGVFKLGAITKFISHAVISGFTSAAAIIIGFSQLKHLLGVDLGNSKNIFVLLYEAVRQISSVHLPTVLIGLISIVILFLLKKKVPKIPGPLVVVVLSIVFVQILDIHDAGVKIVGDIPQGLPSLSIPMINPSVITALLPIAITISIIAFVESYAMAKVIATKEKYPIEPNQELRALGVANIGTSFFSGFPVTGGFSRSAVNYDAGAKSGLATMFTAIFIIITLLFFTSWFYYLPQAVLAAIIIVAVYGLIDVKELKHLWEVKRVDAMSLFVTFIATLMIGIEAGIAIGVVFSLAVFIYRSGKPHIAQLGWVEDLGVYRNVKRFPEAKTDESTLIIRIDSALYFANMAYIEEKLRNYLTNNRNVTDVILDFSAVNDMDAVAIDELDEWVTHENEQGINVYFATVKGPVRDLLKKATFGKKYEDNIVHTIDEAFAKIERGDGNER
ncbi:sulfate permease [Bacillus shivajii]|uniref:SulP family inorganic anion transporter n=1 Tax=Bacillus shivajii TaxID=1983719 RepID=UPI001CFB208A|nr:sulfate permease [Bacillus shivajii]UCZ53565.1 sulfate permease [Bacillus shivajii]